MDYAVEEGYKNCWEIERRRWNGSTRCRGRKVHSYGAVGPMGLLVKGESQSCTGLCCSPVPLNWIFEFMN